MAFTLITVTATYLTESGAPASGKVIATRSASLQDSSTNQIAAHTPYTAHLDSNGHISMVLIANDDPTSQPTGTTYRIDEYIGKAHRRYSISLSRLTTPVDLADLAPVLSSPATYSYALQTALDAETARAEAAEAALQGDIDAVASAHDTFLGLTDTPSSYTGQGGKVVAVKSDTTGLEFIAGGGGGASLSDNNPAALSTSAAPGVGTLASRDDHVHPTTGLATSTQLTSEASTRASADTTLQTNITAEATARANADTTEATARAGVQTNLNTHAALTTAAHGGIVADTDARLISTVTARTPISASLLPNEIDISLGYPYVSVSGTTVVPADNEAHYAMYTSHGDGTLQFDQVFDSVFIYVANTTTDTLFLDFTTNGIALDDAVPGAPIPVVQGEFYLLYGDSNTTWRTVLHHAPVSGLSLSDTNPVALGVASPGVDTEASRSDHVHPAPSPADIGAAAASHTHTESGLSLSDTTSNNATSTRHGFSPKSPADATKFLNGATTPAYAAVKDSDLSTSDITTNNASTTKHGFVPKLPNDATKYYDGTGAFSTPAGGGGVDVLAVQVFS